MYDEYGIQYRNGSNTDRQLTLVIFDSVACVKLETSASLTNSGLWLGCAITLESQSWAHDDFNFSN